MRRGGALELGFVASWVAATLGPAEALWLDDVERAYREPEAMIAMAPWVKDWLHEPSDSDFWNGLATDPGAVEVPVMAAGGWFDIFIDGTIRAWAARQDPRSRTQYG